jgi:anti-sigma B factor antagonist
VARLDHVWMQRMTDSRLDIPGPRTDAGDGPPALEVVARDVTDGVSVVEVRGDLDTMTATGFDGWVRERFLGRRDVVLDLDGVAFLASAGIAVLMGLRQEANKRGVVLHLTGRGNRAVSRPLHVLGLEAVLNLRNDAGAVVAELVPAR